MASNKLFGDAASNIKSVDFTNSKIETFTPEAFGGCGELQKITFGETCKNIELSALDGCNNLQQIVFEGKSAPTVGKQDDSIMKNIIIEVPEGKEKDYQTALDKDNLGATVTAEADILRYTSTGSIKKRELPWIKGNCTKWSETEIPGEIIGKELWARFSWSGEYEGKPVSGTFDAQIEKNEYKGGYSDITGTEVYPAVEKYNELLVYSDKGHSSLLFTIQPYSKLSEKTEYTDNGYTYSFVNVEKPIYSKPTYEGIVVLKDEVKDVGNDAFMTTSSVLTTITLPQQITSIGAGAFKDFYSLTSIELPSGLTSIESYTFDGCTSLTSIELPSGLTSIEQKAFGSCTSLTSIELPSGLTSIESYTFDSCSSLTSIELPSGLDSIGKYAFSNCSSVTSVICRATTPPSLITDNEKNWFSGLKTNICHVPTESISAYESDANWSSQFKSFVAI